MHIKFHGPVPLHFQLNEDDKAVDLAVYEFLKPFISRIQS